MKGQQSMIVLNSWVAHHVCVCSDETILGIIQSLSPNQVIDSAICWLVYCAKHREEITGCPSLRGQEACTLNFLLKYRRYMVMGVSIKSHESCRGLREKVWILQVTFVKLDQSCRIFKYQNNIKLNYFKVTTLKITNNLF